MSLTGLRWGEARAIRVDWLVTTPLPQLVVNRSHSDRYAEKDPKSWRGTRTVPLSPRALDLFRAHAAGRSPDDYLFMNRLGTQLTVATIKKFPLGFARHALRHYAASTWLRLGTPVHEVAEYLGDDPRTVLAIYAHVLGEGQRRDHAQRLADAEALDPAGDPWGTRIVVPTEIDGRSSTQRDPEIPSDGEFFGGDGGI
jgi:integrase